MNFQKFLLPRALQPRMKAMYPGTSPDKSPTRRTVSPERTSAASPEHDEARKEEEDAEYERRVRGEVSSAEAGGLRNVSWDKNVSVKQIVARTTLTRKKYIDITATYIVFWIGEWLAYLSYSFFILLEYDSEATGIGAFAYYFWNVSTTVFRSIQLLFYFGKTVFFLQFVVVSIFTFYVLLTNRKAFHFVPPGEETASMV